MGETEKVALVITIIMFIFLSFMGGLFYERHSSEKEKETLWEYIEWLEKEVTVCKELYEERLEKYPITNKELAK
jgi:hypothetical protein